jgi:hypothetical protein
MAGRLKLPQIKPMKPIQRKPHTQARGPVKPQMRPTLYQRKTGDHDGRPHELPAVSDRLGSSRLFLLTSAATSIAKTCDTRITTML